MEKNISEPAGCRTPGRWKELLERELTERIVPFWEEFSIDREFGGFLTCLDREGKVFDGMKHMWMQWREVYMFAALYNSRFRRPEYLRIAADGFDFLTCHGRMADGRYAYILDRQGRILSESSGGSEVFVEAFAAIAASELFLATGDRKYEEEAIRSLETYEARIAEARRTAPMHRFAHDMIKLNVLSIMRRVFGEKMPLRRLDLCMESMLRFRHPDGIFLENAPAAGGFDLDSQDGRFTNPGHGLEGLSFMLEEFRTRGYAADAFAGTHLPTVLKSVVATFRYGWDAEQGGIWYYLDFQGKPVAKNEFMLKGWWPQNEAATAVLRAYEASGDPAFLDMFDRVERYAWEHLRDPEFPEWFACAPVDGRIAHSYKGDRFKGFFHIPPHLLNCIEIFDRLA